MAGTLARVRWAMGQTLLPEHLRAQEESLIADSTARFRAYGLPAYGIGSLKWSDTLLSEGILSVQSMTMIMHSGLLLDVPANAVISPFNLNAPGAASVTVYCHVTRTEASDTTDLARPDLQEETKIDKQVWQLALSSEQNHPYAVETMKLAVFTKDPEGIFRPNPDYIPPLLQVGTSPFLRAQLDELAQTIQMFEHRLAQDADRSLSGSSLFSAKQCLKASYRFRRCLANVCHQVHYHPYFLYEAMKDFYSEACFYRGAMPVDIARPYDHDRLADSFNRVLVPLREQMLLARTSSPYVPFELSDGVYRAELPPEIRDAKEVYLLVQKQKVGESFSFENVKIASMSRLSTTYKLALHGIPMREADRPMIANSFGAEVEFFQIVEGEEWDHALHELSVAFYYSPRVENMKFYVYWRLG